MEKLLIVFFFLSSFLAFGQRHNTYKSYKIVWDSTQKMNKVIDTLTQKQFMIDFPYSTYACFTAGFIYANLSDMRGVMNLEGKQILTWAQSIHFNQKDSIISAYLCSQSAWIFLDFRGDTLSYGKNPIHKMPPTLDHELNLAATISLETREIIWGYLDKKAKWKIKPMFQEAEDFENGFAKVKINEKWGKIDENGSYIVLPE